MNRTSSSAKKPATVMVEGQEIKITNPDKPLWPEHGITKSMYLERLAFLSPFLLKHCKDRYLTTIRYPHGYADKSFYQKNCPEPRPDFVHIARSENISYVHLDNLPTLLWLGNLACLEFHASFDRISNPDYPTEWILDLDPSREEEPRIIEAAALVGKLLESLNIESVPKTSGATGVQIIVPVQQKYSFDQLRGLGQFVGDYLSRAYPQLFTVERLTKNRGDLIYVDYLQHYRGKTIAAPYTPRARYGAPVSTPLKWDEVYAGGIKPADFHLLNIADRLQRYGDLIDLVKPQDLGHVLSFINTSK
ncbi:bifunctional non-homologous end joining protein LigD [Paenibacillus catalpae]|uniref:Bifunctional non-homologous end joining protein LigD n=1 Tax=Paenibacillus catalpae TaxID=1045775 RepID=A0A1I1Y3U1_9BACL|nr:non-homologous end-joining DNA ligase [Paenibacillus catalpae]SFE12470.1 bifunctional non-homologous end joining protein LigD [Paenibacillus catalpae]